MILFLSNEPLLEKTSRGVVQFTPSSNDCSIQMLARDSVLEVEGGGGGGGWEGRLLWGEGFAGCWEWKR